MFRAHRDKFLAKLPPSSIAILRAAPLRMMSNDTEYLYRQDSDLWYLTGIEDPDAIAVLRPNAADGKKYIVFVKRSGRPVPVWIRTGLTDMDYSEVLSGLTASDSVLVLPSASLVQSQQDMRERFTRATGGGAVPGMQQQSGQSGRGTTRP